MRHELYQTRGVYVSTVSTRGVTYLFPPPRSMHRDILRSDLLTGMSPFHVVLGRLGLGEGGGRERASEVSVT